MAPSYRQPTGESYVARKLAKLQRECKTAAPPATSAVDTAELPYIVRKLAVLREAKAAGIGASADEEDPCATSILSRLPLTRIAASIPVDDALFTDAERNDLHARLHILRKLDRLRRAEMEHRAREQEDSHAATMVFASLLPPWPSILTPSRPVSSSEVVAARSGAHSGADDGSRNDSVCHNLWPPASRGVSCLAASTKLLHEFASAARDSAGAISAGLERTGVETKHAERADSDAATTELDKLHLLLGASRDARHAAVRAGLAENEVKHSEALTDTAPRRADSGSEAVTMALAHSRALIALAESCLSE